MMALMGVVRKNSKDCCSLWMLILSSVAQSPSLFFCPTILMHFIANSNCTWFYVAIRVIRAGDLAFCFGGVCILLLIFSIKLAWPVFFPKAHPSLLTSPTLNWNNWKHLFIHTFLILFREGESARECELTCLVLIFSTSPFFLVFLRCIFYRMINGAWLRKLSQWSDLCSCLMSSLDL